MKKRILAIETSLRERLNRIGGERQKQTGENYSPVKVVEALVDEEEARQLRK